MLKGWIGELKTGFNLWAGLDKNLYHRFHDVIIPSNHGTTQVDHILVSPFGIFVVETKNYKGLDLWVGRPIHLDASYLQIQTQVSKPIEANPQTQESSVKVSQCQRVHHSTSNLVCG